MRIKEEDEWKVAFTTHVGLYEPVVKNRDRERA